MSLSPWGRQWELGLATSFTVDGRRRPKQNNRDNDNKSLARCRGKNTSATRVLFSTPNSGPGTNWRMRKSFKDRERACIRQAHEPNGTKQLDGHYHLSLSRIHFEQDLGTVEFKDRRCKHKHTSTQAHKHTHTHTPKPGGSRMRNCRPCGSRSATLRLS